MEKSCTVRGSQRRCNIAFTGCAIDFANLCCSTDPDFLKVCVKAFPKRPALDGRRALATASVSEQLAGNEEHPACLRVNNGECPEP